VDVTQPAQDTGGPHPLIIMLHGFGNNKHEWESTTDEGDGADKYRWNNHWFATHGYYVLNYTARGFRDDGPTGDQPKTPSFTSVSEPNGTIHLKSRDWEIRDTQWLAALVAATYAPSDSDPQRDHVDRSQIAVTGGSYGGIESWLQASQAEWTFPRDQTKLQANPLPVLQLQVAVPKYPSTDLSYSLTPNGHGGGPQGTDLYESSQGQEDSDVGDGHPIGTGKLSYVSALYALGTTRGVFETGTSQQPPSCTYGNCETPPPISINAWQARAAAGDPYDTCHEDPGWTQCYPTEDPIVQQFRRGLTEFRGSYYQDEGWDAQDQESARKVAVFSIQGWTDDLFPAVESFRQFKSLKRRDPDWPVEVAVADVGHSRAQNRPETWHRLNDQAWQWVQSNIQGSEDQHTTVSSEPTVCEGSTPAMNVTGDSPEKLANGTLTVHYRPGFTVNPLGASDPNGPATDAIASEVVKPGEECVHSDGPAVGGYTAYSPPLKDDTTYIGIGKVHIPYKTVQATTATINVRLFDRASGDKGKKCASDPTTTANQDRTNDTSQTSEETTGSTDTGTNDTSQSSDQTTGSTDTGTDNTSQSSEQTADLRRDRTNETSRGGTHSDSWALRSLTGDKPQGEDPTTGTAAGNADTPQSGKGKDPQSEQQTPVAPDAAPDGTRQGSGKQGGASQCELLISRGTYRLNQPAGSGELDVPFYGNHWKLAPGHRIRLDITQVDQPTYQPSKAKSAIVFNDGVTLTLPTRESGDKTLGASASELAPTLPDLSKVPDDLAKAVRNAAGDIVGTVNGVTGTVEDITGKGKDDSDKTGNAVEGQLPSDVGGVVDAGDDGSDSGGDESDVGSGSDDSQDDGSDSGSQLPDAGAP
jgi:pimeloyl-ACP methyl ester carboxylesterase